MKTKIAYVDDDIQNLIFYKEILSSHFEIDTFTHSVDLINAMEEKSFDCFILDIYMPVMDGFQLLEKIRQQPKYSKIPIFLISSNPSDEVKIMTFRNGAIDFFDRMIGKEELIARLDSKVKAYRESMSFLEMDNLSIDLHQVDCILNNKKIILTLIEFKLLSKLMKTYPNKVSKEELVQAVWGNEQMSANNLNTHLYNLRMKVADWKYVIENQRFQGFFLKKSCGIAE